MPMKCWCGELNRKAKWVGGIGDAHYEPVDAHNREKTQMITCPVCGRRRRAPSGNVRSWEVPVVVEGEWIQDEGKWVRSEHRIEPGQYVCWLHELVTPEA